MVFILTSRWLSGFFYHHQNLASTFRFVLLLPTNPSSYFLLYLKLMHHCHYYYQDVHRYYCQYQCITNFVDTNVVVPQSLETDHVFVLFIILLYIFLWTIIFYFKILLHIKICLTVHVYTHSSKKIWNL